MENFLAKVPMLAGLSPEDLQHVTEHTEEMALDKGDVLFEEGDAGDACYVIRSGELAITKRSGEKDVLIAVRGSGDVIGEMALIDDSPRMATVVAHSPADLLVIYKSTFQHLLQTNPRATLSALHTFSRRLRETQSTLQHTDKLAALGRMTAGVVHELNNPAAAALRAAEQMTEALDDLQQATLSLTGLAADKRQTLIQMLSDIRQKAAKPVYLDPLTRSDREYELETWLEERGVEDAWQLAPLLVNAGFGPEDAEQLTVTFDTEHLPGIARCLGAASTAQTLARDVSSASQRLSQIVGAMKSYAYLDQGPVQNVDVHEGLESTLVMLAHKLKEGVTVTRDYAEGLPEISVHGSELAQVWTNLIDNAVDAMNGKGNLRLSTRLDDDTIVVEIADDGPGIPESVRDRLFEPFFTTKPPGSGTGLGLHICRQIIEEKHGGDIHLTTGANGTTFAVRLPVNGV